MSSTNISRRQFLTTSGGIALVLGTGGLLTQVFSCKSQEEASKKLTNHSLSAWVFLNEAGEIIIYNPAADMGQGSMTALPVIFAEEMDADWEKVRVEFSPIDPDIYGSESWGFERTGKRRMMTVGSRTIKGYYPLLRQAGAQARYVLLNSVAKHWEVPIQELSTAPNLVIHEKTGRQMDYGAIVSILEVPEEIPVIPEEQLKDPANFRLIGKEIPRNDIPSKTDGSALFAIDVQLPDMLYGVIERGRIHCAKPSLNNEAEITTQDGVVKVLSLDYGVGIIATTIEKALEVKKQLDISWSSAPASGFNSQEALTKYEKIAGEYDSGKVLTEQGNFQKAYQSAAKTYTADFKNDYVYHAQMEPLNAVAKFSEDENSVEVWLGSQAAPGAYDAISEALGIEPDNIKLYQHYLGGGLGRRSLHDYDLEAVLLAKAVAPQPVKLIWTREDDVQYGMYRPLSFQRLKACTDAYGNLTGISHLVVGDGERLLASGIKNEFYNIPNQYAEIRVIPEGIRLKHWRAVGHGPNKFAIESLMDEIAADQGIDPADFRRKLMNNSPRALATLEKAVEISNWAAHLPEGRAKGLAFLERSGTLSTAVCEVSVDESTGKIRVHRFWSAHDAGVIVQPDNVIAQMEGGIIMGMSSVLKEQLTVENGEIQQSNYHDYPLLRMEDIPEQIETALIDSTEAPQGVGESTTPLVACAIANAFARLTGKRLRHLPFSPERVLEVLNS